MNPGRSDILGEHAANPKTGSDGFGGGTIPTTRCSNPECAVIGPISQVNKDCDRCNRGHLVLKEWRCSALEDRITAQFEAEVRRRARAAYLDVLSSTEVQDQLEGQRMAAAYSDDFAAGAYNWDDDGSNVTNHIKVARSKAWGTFYLTWLCMRRVDETVTEAQAKAVFLVNPTEAMRTYLWILGVAKNDQPPFLMGRNGESRSGSGRTETSATDLGKAPSPPSMQADPPRVVNLPPTEATFG